MKNMVSCFMVRKVRLFVVQFAKPSQNVFPGGGPPIVPFRVLKRAALVAICLGCSGPQQELLQQLLGY